MRAFGSCVAVCTKMTVDLGWSSVGRTQEEGKVEERAEFHGENVRMCATVSGSS